MKEVPVDPPVVIAEYDSSWPRIFETVANTISTGIGDLWLGIEHIGSTAVVGLRAKPIIDIDVVVKREDMPLAIERLAKLGYVHQGDLGIKDREAFKAPPGNPAHHLYLCPEDSEEFVRHIAFRDWLRTHLQVAAEYALLKQRLAAEYGADRDGYTQAKTAFIATQLSEASEAKGSVPFASLLLLRPI
ncbi:MAG: hypothetical protein DDT37_00262 [Firmicutes bacterium]|nr:hypothetical protein [candidate division NPL-UPA2 bacterium]